MLRVKLSGKHLSLVWDAHDIIRMAKLVGGDFAELQKCNWIPSLAKLAMQKGMRVSPEVRSRVKAQNELVRRLRKLKKAEDAPSPFAQGPQLFPHQRADLDYMHAVPLPAYLISHQPGVGKTPEAAVWTAAELNLRRVLVICPNSAKEQWADEIRRWDHRFPDITIVGGTIAEQIKQISQCDSGWCITHWESLVHARVGLLQRDWDCVIGDEAQLAQNRKAQRTKTLFKLSRISDYRLALSGHPFANDPTELFSILKFLYPDRYKSYWRFFYMFVEWHTEAFNKVKVTGTLRPKLLKWEIAPFTLRRLKRDVWKNLPSVSRVRRVAYLPKPYLGEYKRLKKEFFVELKGRPKKLPILDVLSRSVRIRQWLIDPGLVNGTRPSLKYPVVHEIMQELDGPPVIFTMFKQAGYNLIKWLCTKGGSKPSRLAFISGDATTPDRRRMQRAFLAGKLDALLVVTQAGGVALNLGKYGYVIHLDLPWNARDFEQTEGRVDRPEEGTGKIVPTTSHRVIIHDSFETRVMEPLINSKHEEFSKVFDVDNLQELLSD